MDGEKKPAKKTTKKRAPRKKKAEGEPGKKAETPAAPEKK
jgi:hypothetical protein